MIKIKRMLNRTKRRTNHYLTKRPVWKVAI